VDLEAFDLAMPLFCFEKFEVKCYVKSFEVGEFA